MNFTNKNQLHCLLGATLTTLAVLNFKTIIDGFVYFITRPDINPSVVATFFIAALISIVTFYSHSDKNNLRTHAFVKESKHHIINLAVVAGLFAATTALSETNTFINIAFSFFTLLLTTYYNISAHILTQRSVSTHFSQLPNNTSDNTTAPNPLARKIKSPQSEMNELDIAPSKPLNRFDRFKALLHATLPALALTLSTYPTVFFTVSDNNNLIVAMICLYSVFQAARFNWWLELKQNFDDNSDKANHFHLWFLCVLFLFIALIQPGSFAKTPFNVFMVLTFFYTTCFCVKFMAGEQWRAGYRIGEGTFQNQHVSIESDNYAKKQLSLINDKGEVIHKI